MHFTDFKIDSSYLDILKKQGIINPTKVQEKVIPQVIAGNDMIVQSPTGTGKTLAYLLPILSLINQNSDDLQGLIIVPTRELALQISTVAKSLTENNNINILPLYGGISGSSQMNKLKKQPQLIVATPGRLIDHLRQNNITLNDIKFLVLDEADQLLLTGFKPEIDYVVLNSPGSRQTLFFSATLPPQIKKLAYRYTCQPEYINYSQTHDEAEYISQEVILTTARQKFPTLEIVLDEENPYLAIIFCRTKRRANELLEKMKKYKFNVDVIHSDIAQNKRERILKSFRNGDLQYLIATDVAARGLDISYITNIYNYDVPETPEIYIHRIGRTGRAGESGVSSTFVTEEDTDQLHAIENHLQNSIPKRKVDIRTTNK